MSNLRNIFNQDFRDFIMALNEAKVDYVLVGGYSVIVHGYNRTTGDMDLWVRPSISNYKKLMQAFSLFGFPTDVITEKMFLDTQKYDVFTFGRPPVSIDILTAVKGLDFEAVFSKSEWHKLEDEFTVRVIHLRHLLQAKKKAGRYKDLNDIDELTGISNQEE